FFVFRAHSFIFASSHFRKQLNRVVYLFASERAVQFCVVDVQATVDHPLYYCSYHTPRPLSAVTSNWLKLKFFSEQVFKMNISRMYDMICLISKKKYMTKKKKMKESKDKR
uniref:Secreted protein n=1 Tax=Romanomermis culicivorax TaxID=13658 RepID=A0A915KUY0_ROMCU